MGYGSYGYGELPYGEDVSLSMSGTLPALTGRIVSTKILAASMSGALSPLTGRTVVIVNKTASMSGSLPALKGRVVSITNYTAKMRGNLSPLKGRVVSYRNAVASASGSLPALMGRCEAIINKTASMSGKLPALGGRIYATVIPIVADTNYTGVVINTLLGAHTEYADYDINSAAFVHGKLYLASSAGLVSENELNDETFLFNFKTGDIDSYKGTETMPYGVKREFDPYLSYDEDSDEGEMTLIVEGDKDGAYEYPIERERVPIGKGFDSRFYSFEVVNVDRKKFSLQNIRLMGNSSGRVR